MAAFKLGTAMVDGDLRPVLCRGDRLFDVGVAARKYGRKVDAILPEGTLESVLSALERWDGSFPYLVGLSEALSKLEPSGPEAAEAQLKGARLMAPILYPRKLFMAAANYKEHAREMRSSVSDERPAQPYFFHKPPTTCVVGPGEAIRLPRGSSKVDWEAELAVVIGRRAKEVSASDAMQYVAGYTIVNDVSARDRMIRNDWPDYRTDWLAQKCFDTFAPMGPFLVPKEFVRDPHNLGIRLWVSGELKQNSNTKNLIFDIPEMIEYLSSLCTLEPGDVIATGTPAGVGAPKGTFLKSGDTVVIEIDEVGRLENPVV